MNRKEIKQAIRDNMQLDPGLISNREREKAIWDTIQDLASLGVWEGSYEDQITASPVALPTTFSSLSEAYWNGKRLRKVDKRSLDGTIPTGTPMYCWTAVDPADGITKLFTYPAPDIQGMLKVDFVGKAQAIPADELGTGADLDDLTKYGVPSEWHSAIADGATARAHRKNGNYLAVKEYERSYNQDKNTLYVAALEKINASPTQNDVDEINPYVPDMFIPPQY